MNTKQVSAFSLGRGSAIVDLALRGEAFEPSVSDLIGIVAAYIATERDIDRLAPDMGKLLSAAGAEAAKSTFHIYNNRKGGLWSQGPAWDDIQFDNKKMIAAFGQKVWDNTGKRAF